MFGQYSQTPQARRSKTQMLAEAGRAHGVTLTRNDGEQVARNTLDYRLPDGSRFVRLHDTDVVTIARNGAITLDSGGWQTVTTKDRMNAALPDGWGVYADRGWFVHTPKGVFPYADGAKFKADGTPLNLSRLVSEERKVKALKKQVADFIKHARAKGWGDPAGDPWIFTPDVGREVMLDWVRTKYYTARMMQMALVHAGFQEIGVAIHMSDMARRSGKPDGWMAGKLRRYIYSQLGIA